MHVYAADSLSSTITVYNYIKKDKNADLAIANSISDALDMCAKNDLIRRKSLLLTSTQTPNYVDTFSLDFAFSFANILLLITFIISYRLFADKLKSTPSTLLAKFISITKIRDPLLKKNAAKSRILLACADRRIRQYYLTICAILADYEEQVLLTSIKKNRYCTRYTKHYNFNIYVSLATDTLHLLLKGLVIKMLDFMQDILDNIYPSTIVSLLFVSKAPFMLYFIRAVCDLVTLAQYKNIRMYRALDSICTRANSKAYYITIVKQFYSITNKKEYILQICLHNSQRTALLAANYTTILILRIQPYSIKLPLSEVTTNIAISNFTYAAARSSSKRHNDPKHCNKEVLYLILTIINYTCYDKDRKHIAYIRAFSKILQAFKFYDLSTIIRLVHLVLRDLPNLITYTTMSYYVNNYIN
ncbi:hypothetical protein HBH43_231620 [Parastagonospora nodorum]|nr:hypothetical protein HBH43_231620 [Parastagonospora nodorum]